MNGKDLIACVAMDYSISPGVNGDKPFTRFLIFGPSGQLLFSINLDGRQEKFVPGACVACHGGDFYLGKYPEDRSGVANIGAHFLPYDAGNFEFSSKAGLTEADQEQNIYFLNPNVLNTDATVAEQELIAGWYANGTRTLDKLYVPASWQMQTDLGPTAPVISFYQNVLARSCRTCHAALTEQLNFDHWSNVFVGYHGAGTLYHHNLGRVTCKYNRPNYQLNRAHSMPNSLVTFNRFWLSAGAPIATEDQVAITTAFLHLLDPGYNDVCTPLPP